MIKRLFVIPWAWVWLWLLAALAVVLALLFALRIVAASPT